jgi:hypothetical protein
MVLMTVVITLMRRNVSICFCNVLSIITHVNMEFILAIFTTRWIWLQWEHFPLLFSTCSQKICTKVYFFQFCLIFTWGSLNIGEYSPRICLGKYRPIFTSPPANIAYNIAFQIRTRWFHSTHHERISQSANRLCVYVSRYSVLCSSSLNRVRTAPGIPGKLLEFWKFLPGPWKTRSRNI